MKIPALARGQTMVLFALTMLLTSLLVLMTLSLSTRVKEKMELQAMADAAAYSNAAVTARAYNEIALMSRAQIGKMVSLAAVQSLISWSSYFMAQLMASIQSYNMARLPYIPLAACCSASPACVTCACATKALLEISIQQTKLSTIYASLLASYQSLDIAAGAQSRRIQGAASAIFVAQTERWMNLQDELNDQTMAQEIVNKARAGSATPNELTAPGAGDDVSKDEALVTGAILPVVIAHDHHSFAAMGSRGFSFVTSRFMGAPTLLSRLAPLVAPDTIQVTNLGSAYFSDTMTHGSFMGTRTDYVWSEDHMDLGGGGALPNVVTYIRGTPPCPPISTGQMPAAALLWSTDSVTNASFHTYLPGGIMDPPAVHNLGPCINCPGIWPQFVDYNFLKLSDHDDLEGQPKNHAVIQRDYGVREADMAALKANYPWTRNFGFNFTNSGASAQSRFDNRGVQLGPQNGSLNIGKQTAVSTGIAYYHRGGHWREPPNLLNPYWRATLVPYDVDDDNKNDGDNDIQDSLNDVGVGWAADAFRALDVNGYKGGP
ncbi:MAG: pilus assembly protein [Myxococcaceae bacterium]|nr:pilus assembly protein [Myxococcaceae bacterium]